MADVEAYLIEISTAARNFWSAPRRAQTALNRDTVTAAKVFLARSFDDPRIVSSTGAEKLDLLNGVMGSFVRACDAALAEARGSEGWVEGDAWKIMVRRLTDYLTRWGLPTSSPHVPEAATEAPFVQFIKALQATVPPELRRHHRIADHSLAKQISRARLIPARDRTRPQPDTSTPLRDTDA